MSRTAMPRDTRDTWFLLALIAWTEAPHLARLPLWMSALCACVLAWRALLAQRQAALPGRWSLVLLLAASAGLTIWTQAGGLSRDTSVMLLVLLMALKTLELRARRDAMVLFFLGFVLVLTQFLYSQSLWTALAMGLSVWGWLTALTLAHMPVGRPPLRAAAGLAARAAIVGMPVMLTLFLLFPRIAPLWGMPAGGGKTGLGSELRLGDVAELAVDDSIAMRLRTQGPLPPASQRYLRGPVLSFYDGEHWRANPDFLAPRDGGTRSWQAVGPALDYELTLEPLRVLWLPLLEATPEPPQGLPDEVAASLFHDRDGQWRLRSGLSERVRLTARAWPRGQRDPERLSPGARQANLQVPEDSHPRTRAWALALRQRPELSGAGDQALSDAVLRHIATQGYSYTLLPGASRGDPVDDFWLDRRSGFCEHFAATYVLIMRMLGVPARIVTGYQGGDSELSDGYLVIRQSHAHAWAEIWLAGQGWRRVDPTGAVAPDRIERSQALRAPAGLVEGSLDAVNPGLSLALRRWAESLDNRWNQWVLGYGRQQQFQLLEHLGWDSPDLAALGQALALLLGAATSGGVAWAWWDARRRGPWVRLQALIVRELDRLDVDAPEHLDPGAMARRLHARHGAAAEPIMAALNTLQAWRYGPPVGSTPQHRDRWPSWQREFRHHCAQLRRRLVSPP